MRTAPDRRHRKATCALLLILPLVGYAQVVNHEAPGNLRSEHRLACISLQQARPSYTPADLYPGVAACIAEGKMTAAIELMVLAGAYGRFDVMRVSDESAKDAMTVIQMQAYANLSDPQRESFMRTLEREGEDPKAERIRCEKVSRLGPPQYRPDYMIQHGMGAFTGKAGNGLLPDFEPSEAWEQIRTGYLKCKV